MVGTKIILHGVETAARFDKQNSSVKNEGRKAFAEISSPDCHFYILIHLMYFYPILYIALGQFKMVSKFKQRPIGSSIKCDQMLET